MEPIPANPVELEDITPESVLAKLFPPKARAVIYLLAAMAAPAYAVVVANIDLDWFYQAGYAAFNAGVGALAAANITQRPETPHP